MVLRTVRIHLVISNHMHNLGKCCTILGLRGKERILTLRYAMLGLRKFLLRGTYTYLLLMHAFHSVPNSCTLCQPVLIACTYVPLMRNMDLVLTRQA